MQIHDLGPARGARRRRKRVGRGAGSGHGQTAGRGEKGQKARSGGKPQPWFEGGQLPLHRRVPKRGFTNIFRQEYAIVNLRDLSRFPAGTRITPATLQEAGLITLTGAGLKVLAEGSVTQPLYVTAHRFSVKAAEKIRAAGGTVEVMSP